MFSTANHRRVIIIAFSLTAGLLGLQLAPKDSNSSNNIHALPKNHPAFGSNSVVASIDEAGLPIRLENGACGVIGEQSLRANADDRVEDKTPCLNGIPIPFAPTMFKFALKCKIDRVSFGSIADGDCVNVLLTEVHPNGERVLTVLFRDMVVLNTDHDKRGFSISVLVTEEQANCLIIAEDLGEITITRQDPDFCEDLPPSDSH